jgi:hypothetical protein
MLIVTNFGNGLMVTLVLRLPQSVVDGELHRQRSAGIIDSQSARTTTNATFRGSGHSDNGADASRVNQL